MARDFLSGLIGKAFESTPVLEKRRASMFEPESGATQPAMEWIATSESSAMSRSTAADAGIGPQQQASPATLQSSAKPVEERRREYAETPSQLPNAAVREVIRELSPTPGSLAKPPSSPEQQAVPARVERITERHLETRDSIVEHREVRVERVHDVRPRKEAIARPAAKVVEVHKESPRPSSQRAQSDVAPVPVTVSKAPPPPAAPVPRTPLRARTAPTTIVPPALPTIQVTIGRIELRTPPPAAAPKLSGARARAPKLGLDSYLQQREGGVQ